MALPYLNLYIGDLVKDTDLLSPAAFGGYMRLLFKLHAAIPRGEISYTLPQLCRVFGAATLEETTLILDEIVDPAHSICEYSTISDKYHFTNRRMKRETAISEVRANAGRKGAAKTNLKFQQVNSPDASFATANNQSNDLTKEQQSYNINIGNNGKEENKIVNASEDIFIVPEMLAIFKSHKPNYLFRRDQDFQALRIIAELLAEKKKVDLYTFDGFSTVKAAWEVISGFVTSDNHFKDYQISQIEKYLATIISRMQSNHVGPPKGGVVSHNVTAAAESREILKNKYGNKQ